MASLADRLQERADPDTSLLELRQTILARINEGKISMQFAPVDLGTAVLQTAETRPVRL